LIQGSGKPEQTIADKTMNAALRLTLALLLATAVCGCRSNPPSSVLAPSASQTSTTNVSTTVSQGTDALPDALVSLNKLFLDAYKERQASVKTNITPVIVANFSTVVLYWHGKTETNRCIPEIYHALKAVAHVPFGIFLRVEPCAKENNSQVPDSVLRTLKGYKALIDAATISLSNAGFSESQLDRQTRIFSVSMAYVTNVIATAAAPPGQLISFTRAVGPLLLENANDAATVELDMTHAAVMNWKKRIPPEEWARLVVVVRGPQMPRRMNILTQYFAKLLSEPCHNLGYPLESRRLIYAEFIPKDRDELDLMATTFIDGDASEAFFGDRWRMSRDVLADGAERYLNTLRFER
jgi:hypothetical protein